MRNIVYIWKEVIFNLNLSVIYQIPRCQICFLMISSRTNFLRNGTIIYVPYKHITDGL